jgi:DUF1680 family protein
LAEGIAVTVNGRPGHAIPESDGYLAINRMWKSGDRVDVNLPMSLRQEAIAGSPELASLAYGPLVLAAQMGRDGLSRDMIEGSMGPKMDRLPALPLPKFEASQAAGKAPTWVKKTTEGELRFQTAGEVQDFALKPLYQVMDERYSVYWQKMTKG